MLRKGLLREGQPPARLRAGLGPFSSDLMSFASSHMHPQAESSFTQFLVLIQAGEPRAECGLANLAFLCGDRKQRERLCGRLKFLESPRALITA